MPTTMNTDVSTARLLSDLPAFHRWQNRPLNRQLKQLLSELDEQMLMSLAAHAVQRVAVGPEPIRHPPV